MTTHRHRPETTQNRTIAWTGCVSPKTCPSERTHGNVTTVESCRCGAYRETECNGGQQVRGHWRDDAGPAKPAYVAVRS